MNTIISPTKTLEVTASERKLLWKACRVFGMMKSTRDDERAVLNDVMDKLVKLEANYAFEKKVKMQ